MFIFIIPRTPTTYRNKLRDELWELTKRSLLSQTSNNWKAIVVGANTTNELDQEFFISLNFDEYPKLKKIEIALNFIKENPSLNPTYIIRLDDDDIFSKKILDDIERLPNKYDCYFDSYHTYIDAVYLKLAQKKNYWIANTAIHKYKHAITVCGKSNMPLLMQDHSEYWHIYYKGKKTYQTGRKKPLYYRLLTPFSITSINSQTQGQVDWGNHLEYLSGYGPWKSLPAKFLFKFDLMRISDTYFGTRPKIKRLHWIFNEIKCFKNYILQK